MKKNRLPEVVPMDNEGHIQANGQTQEFANEQAKGMTVAPQPTVGELEQALHVARQQRISSFHAELTALLHRYNCSLVPIQMWRNGVPGPMQIEVVLNQERPPT